MPPEAPKQVQATDNHGVVHALTEDSQMGDWLRYLEGGGTIDEAIIPPINKWQVNAERDRRITGGFMYMGYMFQSDDFSARNIMDAVQAAELCIEEDYRAAETYRWQTGATEDYYWIATDNTHVFMNAYDVRHLGQYMLRMKQRMIRNGRDLKNLDPIPMDYTDDKYWPWDAPPIIDASRNTEK
jgi:hypothetical protein